MAVNLERKRNRYRATPVGWLGPVAVSFGELSIEV